jgi:hypothetical protein
MDRLATQFGYPVDCGRISIPCEAEAEAEADDDVVVDDHDLLARIAQRPPVGGAVVLVSDLGVREQCHFPGIGIGHFCDHKRHNSSFHAAPAVVNNAPRIRIS